MRAALSQIKKVRVSAGDTFRRSGCPPRLDSMSATTMVTADHNRDMLLALLSRNKALEGQLTSSFPRFASLAETPM